MPGEPHYHGDHTPCWLDDVQPPAPRVTELMLLCPHPGCYCNAKLTIQETWIHPGATAVSYTLDGHVDPADADPAKLPVVPGHEVIQR